MPTTFNVTTYPTGNISISNIIAPTTCTGTNGSFQIDGLPAGSTFTLNYRKNAVNVAATTITSTAAGSYILTGLSATTYDSIRVTNTSANGGCVSNIVTALVPSPSAPPTPIPTYRTPLCPGDTLKLSVTNIQAGGTYTWLGPGGYTATGTNPIRLNVTSAFNGPYTATVTVGGCVSSPGIVNVTVNNPDPMPLVVTPLNYCQFDNALPLPAQGANLTFYGPALGNPPTYSGPDSINIPRTSIIPRTDTPGTFAYFVTQNATCVSLRATILVTVKAKPKPPTVATTNVEYCQFSPASPLSASGTNIRWFPTPTGGVGTATAPTPATLVSGTYFFYASQTVNGCESDRVTIRVIVKPKPAPPQVTSPLNLCQGDPIAPATAIGQNLLWYNTATGGVGVSVAPLPNTGYVDSFRFFVSQTVNGCESDRALLSVFVNYRPNGVIVASSQSVCQDENDSFFYYGNAKPDAQYVWFAPYPAAHAVSGGGTSGPYIVHFDTAGTQIIRLTINNKGCISTLISAPITVRRLPTIAYIARQDVCENELVNIALTSATTNISGYNFNFGSDDAEVVYSAASGGPFGIRYPNEGVYHVSATATSARCTSKPVIQDIYVHPLPDAKISYATDKHQNPQDLCASDTLVLSVQAVPEGATYTWTPAAYFQFSADTLNNIVRSVVSRSGEVKVLIRTSYGCEASDSLQFKTKPCCGVFFPNAFAPDGNVTQNKRFRPITTGFHSVNTFRIMNRWGQVVYESKSEPHGPNEGWDGRYNGVLQDMGTYFWYMSYKCDGKNVEDHGEVTLMR